MPIGNFSPKNSIEDKPKEEPSVDMEAFKAKVSEYIKELQEHNPKVDVREAFRTGIKYFIDKRKEKKADKVVTNLGMIELMSVNVDDLTEADAMMWQKAEKYIRGLITKKELDFRGVYLKDVLDSGLSSRSNFYAVLANKIGPTWMEEENKETEEEEKLLKEKH
jgi:hypothetical protein